jgi:hypothetical protein
MLNINNVIFTKNSNEFIETLFKPINGCTAYGTYKRVKGGIKLLDAQGKLFAFVVNNKYSEKFIVSASKLENGKTHYMYGLDSFTERVFGFDKISYIEQNNIIKGLFS